MKLTTIFLRYGQRLPLCNATSCYAPKLKNNETVYIYVQVSNIPACYDQGHMQIRCVYTYCVHVAQGYLQYTRHVHIYAITI